ncbi:MAG: hypothetical protein AAFQ51_12165 [Pseudomonadota bacterium]
MNLTLPTALLAAATMATGAWAVTYATAVDWDGDAAGFVTGTTPFTPGQMGPDADPDRRDGRNALGAPDAVFLSLTGGRAPLGQAVFSFGDPLAPTAFDGGMIEVTEVTYSCVNDPSLIDPVTGLCNGFPETAELYVGASYTPGEDVTQSFTRIGTLFNGHQIGGALAATVNVPFTYVAVVNGDITSLSDGFDIDAVGITPVPLPAGVTLLALSLAGLGVARVSRRRKG